MPWRSPLRGADSAVGIYDRDYYREEPRGVSLFAPRSVVTKIIIVNVVVWLAEFFTPGHWLSNHLAVHIYTLTQPWLWWQY